jgi:glycosyltransferase 2 family protein
MKNFLKHAVTPVFYILITFFLLLYVRSLDLSKFDINSINAWYVPLALVFALAFRTWGAFIWITILRGIGASGIRLTPELLHIYAKSWLARYIPGTAPWILSKIYFASRYGISKYKLSVSSLLEAGLQIVSLFVLSVVILLIDNRSDALDSGIKVLLWVTLGLLLVVLYPKIFNGILGIGIKFIKKQSFPSEHHVNGKIVFTGAALYTIGAAINGIGLFFIAKAFYPDLPYADLLFVISSGTLAGALGMLAIFAPSGIGVRDGIQLALLSIIIPPEFALLITIATRLIDVVADLLFYICATVAKKVFSS